MMDSDISFFENINIININNDHNKYYKDYSNVPDDAVIRYGKDSDELCEKKSS